MRPANPTPAGHSPTVIKSDARKRCGTERQQHLRPEFDSGGHQNARTRQTCELIISRHAVVVVAVPVVVVVVVVVIVVVVVVILNTRNKVLCSLSLLFTRGKLPLRVHFISQDVKKF